MIYRSSLILKVWSVEILDHISVDRVLDLASPLVAITVSPYLTKHPSEKENITISVVSSFIVDDVLVKRLRAGDVLVAIIDDLDVQVLAIAISIQATTNHRSQIVR